MTGSRNDEDKDESKMQISVMSEVNGEWEQHERRNYVNTLDERCKANDLWRAKTIAEECKFN